jgi:hypothetical protein
MPPEPSAVDWPPRSGSVGCGESRGWLTCAAPPPRLALPGERSPRSLLFAEDGTRAPINC